MSRSRQRADGEWLTVLLIFVLALLFGGFCLYACALVLGVV